MEHARTAAVMLATRPLLPRAYRSTRSRVPRRRSPLVAATTRGPSDPDGGEDDPEGVLSERPAFPFSRVVNHEPAKAALLLAAVDPRIGGVALFGRRGTCKTVMARGVHALLPAHRVVLGSTSNADPENERAWEAGLAARLRMESGPMQTHVRRPTFVTLPLATTEDAVVGTIDVEASARLGTPVYDPGLLARAHRGVLYLDELNLLDEAVAACALAAVDAGVNKVEREGVSTSHACDALCIATWNPDEGELRPTVVDRFALCVSADEPLSIQQRVEGATRAAAWQDDWRAVAVGARDDEGDLTLAVASARETLKKVRLTTEQVAWIVSAAVEGGCVGHRAELAAYRAAAAAAALRGSTVVGIGDLNAAAALAIAPRATRSLDELPPPPPPPREEDNQIEGEEEEEQKQEEQKEGDDEGDEDEDTDEDDDAHDEEETERTIEDIVFAPEEDRDAATDAALSKLFKRALQKRKPGAAGRARKSVVFSFDRGRYVKPVFPQGGVVRKVAIDATLRAAAIHQIPRHKKHGDPPGCRRVRVERDDIRNKKMSRRAGTLTVFLVDASGSMALNRMAAAKGAVLRLLSESYTKRDCVAVVSMRGDAAEVLLLPSRSVAMAKARLATLPCGGGTPLAHGLMTAARVAINADKTSGGGGRKTRVVCLTDGGANVGLAWSESSADGRTAMTPYEPSKAALRDEALVVAGRLGKSGIELLVVDTESEALRAAGVGVESDGRTNVAEDLARAAGGGYCRLPTGVGGVRNTAARLSGMLRA